eukprot:CAMPEP_0117688950 /NCGR_PEP_ID=MMETSP0804-20121206/24168_1 /TAXON_ID=1074897 /ORGANISM="Tetraselmis astigmatica, Strain CCMP880" /LENGTH=149 /DNA_ID=CAMNT_0005501567 /DNA_START=717 /DNA_END=1166 /DNA_ORIENTATION=-
MCLTSTLACAATVVEENGTVTCTLFTTVCVAPSMDWVMSPMVTRGRLLAASRAISSLLEVYTSFHSPSRSSMASLGHGVGFWASSCASSSLISARVSALAVRPRSVPNRESSSAALTSSTGMPGVGCGAAATGAAFLDGSASPDPGVAE